MKNLFKILFGLLYVSAIHAQNWCAPNAEWHYTRYYGAGSAYAKHAFTNTVTINSLPCQEINYYTQYFSQLNNAVNTYSTNIYTHVNNNVVYLLDPNSNNFDTLFNFNAVIGSKWGLPNKSSVNCSKSRVLVTDTGHNVIQGVNLKWFKVTLTQYAFSFPTPSTSTDTIYERLGCLSKYMFGSEDVCPTVTDSERGGPLRCYSDNQIINYKKYTGNCNYYYIPTAIKEYLSETQIQVYPNPANDVLNLISGDISNQTVKYQILNNFGQIIISEEIVLKDRTALINTSNLLEGVYNLKIKSNTGNSSKRFVIAR
ncbi:MAG: T9SS type A sorting domain-containing protein [Bacteroidetes bacterium]|nr:T9SS type A sorting domain-containing protein [Bacteroidota bacterium]